jgi:hypothetical protein
MTVVRRQLSLAVLVGGIVLVATATVIGTGSVADLLRGLRSVPEPHHRPQWSYLRRARVLETANIAGDVARAVKRGDYRFKLLGGDLPLLGGSWGQSCFGALAARTAPWSAWIRRRSLASRPLARQMDAVVHQAVRQKLEAELLTVRKPGGPDTDARPRRLDRCFCGRSPAQSRGRALREIPAAADVPSNPHSNART